METLTRRSQTTRAIQNLHDRPDRPDRPDRTQFYPSDRGRLSRPGRLRSSGPGGGGGYFPIRGYWGCAAGWGRIFTTGLTIMGLHF